MKGPFGKREREADETVDWFLRVVLEIELHADNTNKEVSFSLYWAWKQPDCDFKKWTQCHVKISTLSSGP
jgi:hypothetical protein